MTLNYKIIKQVDYYFVLISLKATYRLTDKSLFLSSRYGYFIISF